MARQDTPVSQHMRALISASAVGNRSSSAPAERSSARVMPRMRLRKTTAAAGWRWGGKSTEGGAVRVRAALSSHMCHATATGQRGGTQAARHQMCGLLPPSTNTAVGAAHLPCCWLPPPALPPGHRDAWPAAGHPLSASRVCSPVVRGSCQVSFGHRVCMAIAVGPPALAAPACTSAVQCPTQQCAHMPA